MAYQTLAGAVVALHFGFIVFVVLGALLVARNGAWAAAHLPAVAWVAYIEFSGAICPLTPLENALRESAGMAGYAGGFIERYLLPIIYPSGLSFAIQMVLGIAVLVINTMAYAWIWQRGHGRGTAAR